LLDVMYEIPSRGDVRKCVINADTVTKGLAPILLSRNDRVIDTSKVNDASA
jgi:ATP-dependent Clp protease ATP-binding subunit ClpX